MMRTNEPLSNLNKDQALSQFESTFFYLSAKTNGAAIQTLVRSWDGESSTQLCLCSAGPNTFSIFQQSNCFREAHDGFCVPELNLQPFNYETILPSWWANWNHTAEWRETARNLVSKPTPLLFVFQYSHALQSAHSASGEETWLHSKTWTSTELEHLGQSFFSYSISWGYSWVRLSGFYSHFSDWNRCSFSLRKIACK